VKYTCFRGPSLKKTKAGTLLAFASAGRKVSSSNSDCDSGDVHVVLKRSLDQGKSWGKILTVTEHEDGHYSGGSSPIIDEENGIIHLQYDRDNKQAMYTNSSDDGLTW
jgi:sialidase-1